MNNACSSKYRQCVILLYLIKKVELKPGYYLEARPHAYTEDDKPVYTRTGKVAKKVFYKLSIIF